ncbi:hypothetical protein DUPY_42710 [Duganella phyllosphaerae]|uniref:Uncharacterized protein n=1 Tax=Duganella phyllosphaerae TaxID=762836 RepID=A0A1E7WCZ3_9BURK|nr:hypothetical protein DUPY_42710 [Duganella phyllosphaerae]
MMLRLPAELRLSTNSSWTRLRNATRSTSMCRTRSRCAYRHDRATSNSKFYSNFSNVIGQPDHDVDQSVPRPHCGRRQWHARAARRSLRLSSNSDADGQDERVKYDKIKLENVLMTHVAPSVGAGSILNENGVLKFAGEMALHPAKNQRRCRRQHARPLKGVMQERAINSPKAETLDAVSRGTIELRHDYTGRQRESVRVFLLRKMICCVSHVDSASAMFGF